MDRILARITRTNTILYYCRCRFKITPRETVLFHYYRVFTGIYRLIFQLESYKRRYIMSKYQFAVP